MNLLISGIVVLAATIALLWALLPRGGRTHRFVDTEFEPYVAVALTALVALSFTLLLSGVLNYLG
ncbi:MAG TPA: hypothetical protein VFR19_01965 [Hyphomicrobiaceae bacterium]|jgi:hypothetical protein|nr:hypothetical protein [Hyphomicrobiaceae bacterium]